MYEDRIEKASRKLEHATLREVHGQGSISIEAPLTEGLINGDLGIQIENGRVWICIDGRAVIRFLSAPFRKVISDVSSSTTFKPKQSSRVKRKKKTRNKVAGVEARKTKKNKTRRWARTNSTDVKTVAVIAFEDLLHFCVENGYGWNYAHNILWTPGLVSGGIKSGSLHRCDFIDDGGGSHSKETIKIMLAFFDAYQTDFIYLTEKCYPCTGSLEERYARSHNEN